MGIDTGSCEPIGPRWRELALPPPGGMRRSPALAISTPGSMPWASLLRATTSYRLHRPKPDRFYLTLQLPYYAENFEALLATCRQCRVAVQTIKSIAFRPWMGRPHTATTWYQPLERQDDIDLAVWWVLGHSDVFLNSVGDVDLLPKVHGPLDSLLLRS